MSDPVARPALSSAVTYLDPMTAYEWLQEAFGFEPHMMITDKDGALAHSELRFGDCLLMVGIEWAANTKSPRSLGGANTQTVHVQLAQDIDAHCERARRAGATILQEPQTQFYGDRTYRCLDREGHMWTFGQTVAEVSIAEMEQASGLTIQTSPDP